MNENIDIDQAIEAFTADEIKAYVWARTGNHPTYLCIDLNKASFRIDIRNIKTISNTQPCIEIRTNNNWYTFYKSTHYITIHELNTSAQ